MAPTAPNLTPEEQAIVERANRIFEEEGDMQVPKHLADKMQSGADVGNATAHRQNAKKRMIKQANKDADGAAA